MGTISSSLQLFDAMTKPLSNITNSLNLTISAMSKMQTLTDKNSDVAKTLNAAKSQLSSAESQIKQSIEQSERAQRRFNSTSEKSKDFINQSTKAQNNFNSSMKQSNKNSEELLNNIKHMVAAYLSLHMAKEAVGEVMKSASEQRFLQDMFSARIGDDQVGRAMFESFKKEALRVGADVQEYLQGTLGNLSVTTNTNQLKELNMLAKQLSAFDTTGQGIEGAFFSLKEALSGDIVSLSDRFNMSKSLIRQFKVDQLGKSGDLDGFIKAFQKLLEAQNMGHDAFERMLNSPIKKAEILRNKLKQAFTDSGQSALEAFMPVIDLLNNAFDSGKLQPFLTAFSNGLSLMAEVSATVVNFIIEHWTTVQNILIAVGVVVAAVTAIWIVQWIAAAWPIFAVIAVIALLLGLMNMFGVSTGEVISYVIGAFYSMFAVINNQIALAWNFILAFVEFFANVFTDPIYAIKKLFYDLAMTFGGYMYNMIRSAEDFASGFTKIMLKAVNKALEGFNWLVDKINGIFGSDFQKAELLDEDNVHAVSDGLKKMMDMIEKPTSDKNVVDLSKYKMQYKNPKESFNNGFKSGSKILDKVNNAMNVDKILGKWNKTAGPTNRTIPNVGKVGKVGKIEDKVDISSEDLKTMRELAEMKAIQNFVTLTPTVQVKTGDINHGADIDTIITKINTTLQEEIASAAAGVYGVG